MALLDTFLLVFDADTSKLQESEKQAEKQADKLQNKIEEVDDSANNLGDGFSDMIATAGGALTALLSFTALSAGIAETAQYADTLAKTSDRLGENINDLAAFQEVVKKSGGDVGSFESTLKKLSGEFTQFAITGNTGIMPFMQQLGISMVDSSGKARKVLDVLPELADKFQGLSAQESAGLGERLGLDEGTVLLLQKGRAAVEEQIRKQKELFSITREQAKIFEDFNDAVDNTSTSFRGLFVELGAEILPILGFLLERVQDVVGFFKENKDFTVGLFIALGAAITAYAIPALIKFGPVAWKAFLPFLKVGGIIGGIVVAFGLLYDDITAFLEGGNSAFGKLLKWMGASKETIESVRNALKGFFSELVEFMKAPLTFIENLILMIGKLSGITDVFSSIGNFLGFGPDQAQLVNKLSAEPLNSMNTTSINSNATSNRSVNVGNITVQTQATNSEEISKTLGKTFRQELNNMTNTLSDNIKG